MKRFFVVLFFTVLLLQFHVSTVFATGFLTLPFEGEFGRSATFCSYKNADGSCHGGNDYPMARELRLLLAPMVLLLLFLILV